MLDGGPSFPARHARHGEPRNLIGLLDRFGGGARSWLALVADLRTGGAWLAMVTLL